MATFRQNHDWFAGWEPHHFVNLEASYTTGSVDECWTWHGSTVNGQPIFDGGNVRTSAALLIYEQVLGLPKTDKYIQTRRTCGGPMNCVNPHHRRITLRKHGKRPGRKPQRPTSQRRLDVCLSGRHDLTLAGARVGDECRACRNERNRGYAKKNQNTREWHERAAELLKEF